MDLIKDNGVSWGFTVDMRADRDQIKALKDEIGSVLTPKRNAIKNTILASLGSDPSEGEILRPDALNVVELADTLTSQQKISAKVDVALCGRVALLRKIVTEEPGNRYWTTVDSELANLRAKHPNATNLSKFIKRYILDEDFKIYGSVDIPGLSRSSHSRRQATVPSTSAVASGSGSASRANVA